MIVYLCGKMTGLPDYNYPQFHAWAKRLRDAGHTVRNPAEEFDGDQSRSRSEYMERAYDRIMRYGPTDELGEKTYTQPCAAIAVLPHPGAGDYRTSDGCFFELHLALIHKIPVWWAGDLAAGGDCIRAWDNDILRSFVNPPSARIPLDPPSVRVVQHEAGMQPVAGEVRVVDPETGGEKGRKPQRYSLVPMREWEMVLNATSPDEDGETAALQARQALSDLCNFISIHGDDEDRLCSLADRLVNALNGPTRALEAVAEVYGYGEKKYASRNWERGYAWSLSIDSCYRHLVAFIGGQTHDPESGLPHLAHALFHVLALLTFVEHYPEKDDRSELYKQGGA